MDILQRLQEIFREVFEDEFLVITRDTSQDDIEQWDSLAQITIVSRTEELFNIEFEISEIISFESVGNIIDVISKKIN